MNVDLKSLFESWGQTAKKDFVQQQWLLSKWEVIEGIVWSQEKIDHMIQSIVVGLDIQPTHTVIDLGCGGGWILKALKPHAKKVWGLDFSQSMLTSAAQYYGSGNHNPFVCGEIGKLPLQDSSVDRALSYFVFLNFMDDQFVQAALLDVVRILNKGGRALIGQLPDKTRSQDYDKAKAAYLEFCRRNYQLGASHREICQAPQKLFDKSVLEKFLKQQKIRYEFRKTFNPFYRPGVDPLIDWRFDLILYK